MQKGKGRLNLFWRITVIVIPLSLWTFPVYGEQPIPPLMNSETTGTRFWTDLEIQQLVDEISEAAEAAIERAAAEAAMAASLAALEREAAALREAERWRLEAENARQGNWKNYLLAGALGFLGGLVTGIIITR